MRLLIIFLVTIFLSYSISCTRRLSLHTFEFGKNFGEIGFTTSGSIRFSEKIKRISVVIPQCSALNYVKVDINSVTKPSVQFDWETRTVIIEYRPLQRSTSEYTVSAKTTILDSVACNPGVANMIPFEVLEVV